LLLLSLFFAYLGIFIAPFASSHFIDFDILADFSSLGLETFGHHQLCDLTYS
jgi:hypothetical protein